MSDMRTRMQNDGAEEIRPVDIPKWGNVYVRDYLAGEHDAMRARIRDGAVVPPELESGSAAFTAAVLLCDEAGERLFDPLSAEDLAFLSKRRREDLLRVISVATQTEVVE